MFKLKRIFKFTAVFLGIAVMFVFVLEVFAFYLFLRTKNNQDFLIATRPSIGGASESYKKPQEELSSNLNIANLKTSEESFELQRSQSQNEDLVFVIRSINSMIGEIRAIEASGNLAPICETLCNSSSLASYKSQDDSKMFIYNYYRIFGRNSLDDFNFRIALKRYENLSRAYIPDDLLSLLDEIQDLDSDNPFAVALVLAKVNYVFPRYAASIENSSSYFKSREQVLKSMEDYRKQCTTENVRDLIVKCKELEFLEQDFAPKGAVSAQR